MFLLYFTFIICLWNIFCAITKIGVKLKYDNEVKTRETLLSEKKVKTIAGVKYNILNPPFWVEIDPIPVYNSIFFKNESLSQYQIYCHMDCFGVDSVELLSKKDSIMSGIKYTITIMSLFLFLNQLYIFSFVFIFQLLDYNRLSHMYLRFVKGVRNKFLKNLLQSFFEFSRPCDEELYELDEMTLIMLEHCNPHYAIEMPYTKIRSSFKAYFSNVDYSEGEHSLIIPLNFDHQKMEMKLDYELIKYAGYNLFTFNLMIEKYFVEHSILFENDECIHNVLNESCKNILTAMIYGSDIKCFDKIRDGSTHKKEFFKCNDFKICCLMSKIFVKGYIDMDSALKSIFPNDKKKITISPKSVKNQIEYAEKFFCNREWANNTDNMSKLLSGLKHLIVNKSARNVTGMPNSAWKRFCSDCSWISDVRYKGLDHKNPSKTLSDFSEEKGIELTDPSLKYYNKAEFISKQKTKDRNTMKEYFAKENENRIKFSEELSSLNRRRTEKVIPESKNKELYLNICRDVRSNVKINLEDKVVARVRSVEIEHTKETYKEKLISKLHDLEKELDNINASLRSRSTSNKDKQDIKNNMYKTKTMVDICKRSIINVDDGDFSEIRHFRFTKDEKASVSFTVDSKDQNADILVLFNSYDVLRDLESKESKTHSTRSKKKEENIKKEEKEEIIPEMSMFIRECKGVTNAKEKVQKEIKIRTGIDCDEMLTEKIRLKLLECIKKFNRNKSKTKSKIINRYKTSILNNIDIDEILILEGGKNYLQIPIIHRTIKRLLLSNMFSTCNTRLFQRINIMNSKNEIFHHLRSLFK